MTVSEAIKTVVNNFCSAVRASEDGRDSRVIEALDACEEASATWEREGAKESFGAWADERAKMSNAEPVLQASSQLMDAVHEVNPDGLPPAYRDHATRTQKLLDTAEERLFRVRAPASARP